MFSLQNFDFGKAEIDGLAIVPYKYENNIAKFDLSLDAGESENGIDLFFEYSTKLFKPETIQRMRLHFTNLLEAIINQPEAGLFELEIISEEEKQQLLCQFNHTQTEYPKDKTIQDLFEEQAARTPDQIAVIFEEQQLSYRELNEQANQLAWILRNKGVKPDTVVGIMVERSLHMVVGLLGVLKAGGAYLPIDPDYPKERIKFIIEDCRVSILLTQSKIPGEVLFGGETIDLEDRKIYNGNASNPAKISKPGDLAYIIYTSGTTGQPKGVMIENRSYVNISYAWKKEYRLDEGELRLLQMASFSFDVFAGDISRALLNGSQLIICPGETRLDPPSLYLLIKKPGSVFLNQLRHW